MIGVVAAVAAVVVAAAAVASARFESEGICTHLSLDMVTARFSDNDVEFIGCGIRTFDDGAGGTFTFGFCQATDSAGVNGFCQSTNTDLLLAMAATADFSFITFGWDAVGDCTRIGFSTQSFYLPDGLVNDDDDDSDSPGAFLGDLAEARCTGRGGGAETGFSFRTGELTADGFFAEFGYERNGVFL